MENTTQPKPEITSEPSHQEYEKIIYHAFKNKIEEMGASCHVFAFHEDDIKKIFAFYFWAICVADVHKLHMLNLKDVIPAVQCDGEDGYDTEQDLEFHFKQSIPDWMENPYLT
jgi:hypothetical protein